MNKNVTNKPERQQILALGPLYTIKDLFERSADYHGGKNIVCEKHDGRLVYKSAVELRDDYKRLATAMLDLGLEGENIAIISENSYRYIVSYAAIVTSVGVAVPLDRELRDDDIIRLLDEANCAAVLCSRSYIKPIVKMKDKVPSLKYIIAMDTEYDDENVETFDALLTLGGEYLEAGDTRTDEHNVHPDDVAAILFTSGTTGANKGVMLTHKNITSNINDIIVLIQDDPSSISLLPMNHTFEFNCHILPAIYVGMTVNINSSVRYLMSDLKLYRPYMTVMVPLFLEAIYKAICDNIEKNGMKKQVRRGIILSKLLLRFGFDARRSIFKNITEAFGGNFHYIVCGGAPVNPETVERLCELGFDIVVGYGMTECSPIISVNRDADRNAAHVGTPVPSTEVMINDPDDEGIGEIMIRGDKIAVGYYNDERSFEESFIGRWFLTGDYGKLDKKGNLYVTGRKKSLIVLDNGKNVYPEEIEGFISERVPYIKEMIVHEAPITHAHQSGIIAATVVLDEETFADKSPSDIDIIVKADMREMNRLLPTYKQIRYVYISTTELPKTSTKKIIREQTQKSIKRCRKIKI